MSELFRLTWAVSILGCDTSGAIDVPITGVSIDSRECRPGSLFVALPGTRTDGHKFVEDAFANGAGAALVASNRFGQGKPQARANVDQATGKMAGVLCVVESPLRALQKLAAAYLDRFPELVRIAVTGSNGKTTTKELIASVLSEAAPTYRSAGNYNSEIGLPLAAFGIRREHRYAVFEMAMSRPGEIANLAAICRPQHACVTNVGSAHIGHIGSREGIAKEKRQIFSKFDGRQTAYVSEAEPYRQLLLEGVRGRVVLFGEGATEDFEHVRSEGLQGSIVRVGRYEVRLAVPGSHNVANAACAVALARELGVRDDRIAAGLEKAPTLFGRSEFIRGPVSVYQDCYNANPESMEALIRLLETTGWDAGRRIVVLGAMKELGDAAGEAHRAVARLALSAEADRLILVGEEFEHALNGSSSRALWYPSVEELERRLPDLVEEGDLVVLKGSRSSGLERLVPRLQDRNR